MMGVKNNSEDRYVPVRITSDESSHRYIVPNDEYDEFIKMGDAIIALDDDYDAQETLIEQFEEKFGKYRTGGSVNNYQLHISEDELKRLTG